MDCSEISCRAKTAFHWIRLIEGPLPLARVTRNSDSRSKSRSKDNKLSKLTNTTWNPFQKVISYVTGSAESSITNSTESLNPEQILIRWTASCFTATCPLFSRSPNFNMLYCPLPSLLMFTIVSFSSEPHVAKHMKHLFELNDQDLRDIEALCQKIHQLTSSRAFVLFVRFLVDEERTTTVSKDLMQKCGSLYTQAVFASIRPSRVVKYLSTLGFSTASVPRPALLTTNAYGSSGIIASWNGRTKPVGRLRFASTYHKKKLETYFEINTDFRRVVVDDFDVIDIGFVTNDKKKTAGKFMVFRPQHTGNLPYSNRLLTNSVLETALKKLEDSEVQNGDCLIPQFCVSSSHDLWKNLLRHGIQGDLGQSHKSPPMASMWHWASVCVSEDGIREKLKKKKKSENETEVTLRSEKVDKCRGRIDGELLYEKHKPYSIRIDSPFSYVILLEGLPIFSGSYFGCPAPKSKEIFMNAPERIRRLKPKRLVKKAKGRETRKQKLWKQIRKEDEKEKEKERKSREKARKKKKKKASKTVSNSNSNSSTHSESNSKSSSDSKSAPSESPKSEKKSKSSGWKKIKKLFKK